MRALSRIECDELLTFELHIWAKAHPNTITVLSKFIEKTHWFQAALETEPRLNTDLNRSPRH
jgi:hypothetical protein